MSGFSFRTYGFRNFLEICRHVQEFIFISKYNLKRNSMSNGRTITFVCSCISKKEIKFCGKNYEENSPSTSENCKSSRKIKRQNIEACRFRLKFKQDKESHLYILHKSSNFIHNHPPHENISVEVSIFLFVKFILI